MAYSQGYFVLFSFLSFALPYTFLKIAIPGLFSKFNVVPNKRSAHKVCTPTAAGAVFIFPILVLIFVYKALYRLPLIIAWLMGLIDDSKGISPAIRLLIQGFATSIIFSHLFQANDHITLYLLFPLLIFIGVGITNFINFMDGVDGLVSSSFLILTVFYSFLFDYRFLLFSFTLLSLLIFNWSPAKIFIGNVGSYFLGTLLIFQILFTQSPLDSLSILLVSSPLLIDPSVCIIRRFLAGQKLSEPHQLHLYQRLYLAGWTHSQVSSIYLTAISLMAIAYCLFGIYILTTLFLVIISLGIWLSKYKAKPFLECL